MKVIFYTPEFSGPGERILKAVESFLPKELIVIYMSMDQVRTGLKDPDNNLSLGVFVLSDKKHLLKTISLGGLLRKMKLILLLPDRDEETLSLAHKLKPSYIAFTDSDMTDVSQVLMKMINEFQT